VKVCALAESFLTEAGGLGAIRGHIQLVAIPEGAMRCAASMRRRSANGAATRGDRSFLAERAAKRKHTRLCYR
jgi:hypothetical protein